MKNSSRFKLMVGLGILILVWLFFQFDLDQYFSLVNLKNELDRLRAYYQENMGLTIGVYMAVYIIMSALSLPGATVLTLAGGALFGFFAGVVIVSFASTIGATLAFLLSRYIFRDWVQTKFYNKINVINAGIKKEGGFYLFTLRLVPVFPFFMINLAMGLTPIPTGLFYLVSQLGMFPGTIVYINAGTQLAKIDSLGGILSPALLFAFALLGLFPFFVKKSIGWMKLRKVYANYLKPIKFDYNIVVIGAGAAGLVSSYIASAVKAKVALVEENKMGGDCLNTGCVPSKALIASAKLLSQAARGKEFGVENTKISFDFAGVMDRVQSMVKKIAPHDSVERYTKLGVTCVQGRAKIVSPFNVRVKGPDGEQVLITRNIIVATGAKPAIPLLKGIEKVEYLTSDTIWDIRTLPERLVVLGAGPIGCELAQAFARLGSKVTLVQRGGRILKKEDPDAAKIVMDRFSAEGMELCLNHKARQIRVDGGQNLLVCEHLGKEVLIPFDRILVALGRTPNIAGFGLEELGVTLSRSGHIETNGFLQTNYPNIFCCGDVHGRYLFTHTAAHEAWYASVNALFGRFKKFRVDYSVIPWATYTDPGIARVGINEQEAKALGIDYEKVIYKMDDLDRAVADSQPSGFVKVLTPPGRDKILGVTIVGHHGADIIAEFVLAMKYGLGLNKILGTIHIYPTMAEANKYAAGQWKKSHAPRKLLMWVERFHAWMRN
ncbi:MAG: FAD-dependent oxidoreductase [Desulfobacteraceae bacterium]|nr:FAD-dependent oxidoreductase [Desulfobacteraceae bacterium]